jgi:hypothetical protein
MVLDTTAQDIGPYPGPHSFRWGDRRRFFGRAQDSFRLKTQVTGEPLSILHAPSGAGKTSLINAGLMAPLEADDLWLVGYVRPIRDPLQQLVSALVESFFPDPSSEADAIDALIEASRWLAAGANTRELGDHTTLSEARQLIDGVAASLDDVNARAEPARALLSSRFLTHMKHAGSNAAADSTEPLQDDSIFRRFLEYPSGRRIFVRHLAWLAALSRRDELELPWTSAASAALKARDAKAFAETAASLSLGELKSFLRGSATIELWSRFRERLTSLAAGSDERIAMAVFLTGLAQEVFELSEFGLQAGLSIGPPPAALVIFDQFEELFTQLPFAKRSLFFDQFEETYRRARMDSHCPLRRFHFLVSLRDEHVADLDRLRPLMSDPSRSTFHLGFIRGAEMARVIQSPAEQFGFQVDEEFVKRIVADLKLDDDTVEPALVQIVLAYIWKHLGKGIQAKVAANQAFVLKDEEVIRLGTIVQIMSLHIDEAISDAAKSDSETDATRGRLRQFELLEILDQLTRRGDHRAIVSEQELMNPLGGTSACPVVDGRPLRGRMIDYAIASGLARRHRRRGYGGELDAEKSGTRVIVEVTHERLIPGISTILSKRLRADSDFRHLQSCRHALGGANLAAARRTMEPLLNDAQIFAASKFAEHLAFDARAIEVLFRSALLLGHVSTSLWAEQLDAANLTVECSDKLAGASDLITNERWLDRVELRTLGATVWSAKTPQEAELVVRSLISECGDGDDDLLILFARRLIRWTL